MGLMNVACSYCHALHWKEERLTKSSLRNPKFGKCCLSGKIWLPTLDQLPPELHNLLISQNPRAKGFRTNIRKYNDALAMTSVGRDLLPMEVVAPMFSKSMDPSRTVLAPLFPLPIRLQSMPNSTSTILRMLSLIAWAISTMSAWIGQSCGIFRICRTTTTMVSLCTNQQ